MRDLHSVTCDGAPTNLLVVYLDDIKGSFSYEAYDHPLFFIADACHMLKLARNALADVNIFVDCKVEPHPVITHSARRRPEICQQTCQSCSLDP